VFGAELNRQTGQVNSTSVLFVLAFVRVVCLVPENENGKAAGTVSRVSVVQLSHTDVRVWARLWFARNGHPRACRDLHATLLEYGAVLSGKKCRKACPCPRASFDPIQSTEIVGGDGLGPKAARVSGPVHRRTLAPDSAVGVLSPGNVRENACSGERADDAEKAGNEDLEALQALPSDNVVLSRVYLT
jgi:hypothetical protein